MNYLCVGFGIFIGFIIGDCIGSWPICNPEFLKIRLYEVLNLIAVVGIAVFITYYVNKKSNLELKKKEMIVSLLKEIRDAAGELIKISYEYIEGDNNELSRTILRKSKEVEVLLSSICNVDILRIDFRNLLRRYHVLKELITDAPFGNEIRTLAWYSPNRISSIEMNYRILLSIINMYLLKMYS